MVATMASYLDQLEVSARPGTVADAELTLRLFAHRVSAADPNCVTVAGIGRVHIEDFKRWLVARPGKNGKGLSTLTIRHRLSTMRTFFERIMEWEYDDAPARLLIYSSDFPALDEPLPKFLDDPTASKFMAALAADPEPAPSSHGRAVGPHRHARRRARPVSKTTPWCATTGSIACGSPSASCTTTATCPLLPMLVDLIIDYKALRGPSRSGHLLERDDGRPFDRRTVHRYVAAVAKRAGIGPRPSPPAAPHARHPVHQPGHEPRGDRRLARAPLDGHDAHLRPHLGPHRRRCSTSR